MAKRADMAAKLQPTSLPVQQLSEDLYLDLEAFCEAHWGAPKARIVREALRSFIDTGLAEEPNLKKRFEQAKHRILKQGFGLLVMKPTKDSDAR